MSNTTELQKLLDKIQEIKRIRIGSISLLAGYKRENYLSERLSSGSVSNKTITAVTNLYNKAKENPDILRDIKVEDNKFLVNHDLNKFLGERIELGAAREAAIRVLVIWMKEVYAEVFKRPFVEVSLEFDRLAANELMQILDQLRQQQ